MRRLGLYIVLLLLAAPAAGLFGALHDQISYTVSPEYFTRFKFFQFHLTDSMLPERLRVAEIGFLASWWMEPPLAALTGLGIVIHKNHRVAARAVLWSLPVSLCIALLVALGGLVFGYIQTRSIDMSRYDDWFIPDSIIDLRAYLCVGYMHNAAYLSGYFAVPLTWLFHVLLWARSRQDIHSSP